MDLEFKGLRISLDGELTQEHLDWLQGTVYGIASSCEVSREAILAAALAGEGKGPAPYEVGLYKEHARWRSLPHPGGLLQQPAGLLTRMRTLYDIFQAFVLWSARGAGKEDEFAKDYPGQWAIVQKVMELRG
jgi:hypothetical protein